MKTIIFAGVVALALTSMAQGTAPTAAPTAQPTTAAKAPAAKKAAKATKATAKPKAAADVVAPAAVRTGAAATPEAPAEPAVGTSTSSPDLAKAPSKKWGASVAVNPFSSVETPTEVGSLTTLGASYKVTPDWKVSLKHTFQSVPVESVKAEDLAEADVRENNFRSAYSDLGLSTSLPAVLGSDAIALSMGYRHVSRDALMTRNGTLASINAHFDVTAIVPWTLSPKTAISLLANYRHFDVKSDGADRVIAQPSVSYAINDMVSVYQAAGLLYSTNTAFELRKRRERLLLETGVDIAPLKGLSINLNINQDKAMTSSTDEVSDFTPYKPNGKFDYVYYDATISYSF